MHDFHYSLEYICASARKAAIHASSAPMPLSTSSPSLTMWSPLSHASRRYTLLLYSRACRPGRFNMMIDVTSSRPSRGKAGADDIHTLASLIYFRGFVFGHDVVADICARVMRLLYKRGDRRPPRSRAARSSRCRWPTFIISALRPQRRRSSALLPA